MGRVEGMEPEEKLRVLVVDDSPVDRKIVQLLLNNHRGSAFHVTVVDSGKKAMELLGQKPQAQEEQQRRSIDIVLTDYCMPEMTGYDLLKAIKALNSPNPIPVVVMSSENEPQRINRCLTAGAEDFIVKPLRTKDVQRLRNSCSAFKPANKDVASESESEQRPHPLAGGLAMVLKASSSVELLSHYVQFLLKFLLLAYAALCLAELLHRWLLQSNACFSSSNGIMTV
ncbi:two-component response regulator ORR2 [Brachypodium distachyon]|uniref:Response regulatory domain-containing protein n=1 Tax=Brachypodium distachyon TaxID=15368 RepID=I1IAK1_BRADI|nr:two-component response regulator ORR2 [Brachypodium distachyon]KQJ99903.1 hypothetical protein BRADI_3g45930v3 [Brachypodium distachyon]|eukprot:XP_003575151.1 two-component response regulator ORR2 [Brachypodium distachyon]